MMASRGMSIFVDPVRGSIATRPQRRSIVEVNIDNLDTDDLDQAGGPYDQQSKVDIRAEANVVTAPVASRGGGNRQFRERLGGASDE
jgi:hypothetical protein